MIITLGIISGPKRHELGFRLFQSSNPAADPNSEEMNRITFRAKDEARDDPAILLEFRMFSATVGGELFNPARNEWRFVGIVMNRKYAGQPAVIQYNMSTGCGTIHIDTNMQVMFFEWLKENR